LAASRGVELTLPADGKGGLPWHLPEDWSRFRAVTMGHPVIMGRESFAGFSSPLAGRLNIVVTRDADHRAAGVVAVHTLEAAIAYALARDDSEVLIGGGAMIYREPWTAATGCT
jgi:dihydrofolate reductase